MRQTERVHPGIGRGYGDHEDLREKRVRRYSSTLEVDGRYISQISEMCP
jgi:hypothetical protein